MNCLNNWYCIDACYKKDIQDGFSKCKCFDDIPSVEDDKDHLTLLGTAFDNNYGNYFEMGYATHTDGIFEEDRFYNRPNFSLYSTVSAIFKDSVYIFGAELNGDGPYDARAVLICL